MFYMNNLLQVKINASFNKMLNEISLSIKLPVYRIQFWGGTRGGQSDVRGVQRPGTPLWHRTVLGFENMQ